MLLWMFMRDFLDLFFRLRNGESAKEALKIMPKRRSSPQPPHLNSAGGGSLGMRPHEHLVVAPIVQALEMACAREADDKAYTNACSRLPEIKQKHQSALSYTDLNFQSFINEKLKNISHFLKQHKYHKARILQRSVFQMWRQRSSLCPASCTNAAKGK